MKMNIKSTWRALLLLVRIRSLKFKKTKIAKCVSLASFELENRFGDTILCVFLLRVFVCLEVERNGALCIQRIRF